MKIIKFSIFLALFIFAGVAGLRIAHAASVQTFYSGIPMSFTKNIGQTDSRVSFSAPGKNCTLFFTKSGTTILLHREKQSASVKLINPITPDTEILPASMHQQKDEKEYESFAVKVNFHGANPNPQISGENELSGKSNYFIGADSTQWKTDVPSYGKIRLKNLYDGIDLVYYGGGSGLKYDFVVSAGKDPSKIALGYDLGANVGNALSIGSGGSLTLRTPLGEIIEKAPVCYQTINGQRVLVEASYRIIDPESNIYGFTIGSYDSRNDLCIDPELGYSCFIGGTEQDGVNDIAVDKDGNVYITGQTAYSGFPSTPGVFETGHENYGCFVLKINPSGSNLIYSAFIGESNKGISIAVDSEGNVFVGGEAENSKTPVTAGARDKGYSGGSDIFILKLNANGNSLLFSTYLGGTSYEELGGIDIDIEGNVYITGVTLSTKYEAFPITSGVVDSVFDGQRNCFVTKLNSEGSKLVYSTLLGGKSDLDSLDNVFQKGIDIKVESNGNVYILGAAATKNFPVSIGAYDTDRHQAYKYFLLKLNSNGTSILNATFLKNYTGNKIELDKDDNVFIVGDSTKVVTGKEVVTVQSLTEAGKSSGYWYLQDGFLLKLNNTLSSQEFFYRINILDIYAKFCDIVVDNENNIFITGQTKSTKFPVTKDAYRPQNNGDIDCFLVKLDSSGTNILYSTYYGGNGEESEPRIAADKSGNVYISGTTQYSGRGYFVTPGAYSTINNGGDDIFIAKFIFNPVIPSVEEQEEAHPDDVSLTNSPNPFNPTATIEYSIPKETRVALKIYNITGQEIAVLRDGIESAGSHSVIWDAKGMPSGVYFCSMKAEGYTGTRKMMLVR